MSTDTASRSLTGRIAGFVADAIVPIAPAMARGDGPSPKRIVEAAGEAGLAGILTPEAHGGAGGSHADFIELIENVARADASCAVILDVHLSVGTEPLLVFGNDDQKSRYLPRLARGEWLAAFALTEAAGGSDAVAMRTRAVRDGDTYVLDGAKAFITGAGDADLYIVMARTGEGSHGISAFLVESAMPGVSTGPPLGKMGLHGSWTGSSSSTACAFLRRIASATRGLDSPSRCPRWTVAGSVSRRRRWASRKGRSMRQSARHDAAATRVSSSTRPRSPTWRCAPPRPGS